MILKYIVLWEKIRIKNGGRIMVLKRNTSIKLKWMTSNHSDILVIKCSINTTKFMMIIGYFLVEIIMLIKKEML